MRRTNRRYRCPWEMCAVCGGEFPISLMTKQRGAWVCTLNDCIDNKTIERHPYEVARILGTGAHLENVDERVTNPAVFGEDEVII